MKLVDTLEVWQPVITGIDTTVWERILPPLALLLGAGLGFVWLLHQAILRTRVRQPEPPRIRSKGKSFLPPLSGLPDFHLLGSDARREMGWGISHYLSEQPLKQLDIPRSVAATARSGLPSIHFRTASREREVWLWRDQASNNPDLSRLAAEITATLQAVNIFVQPGYFHGLPARVVSPQGEVLWSKRHEYPENQPLVVVLADGASLAQMGAAHSDDKHATFRQLGHWANLCLVDCSQQPGSLCQQLKPYSLECLLPQAVSSWLARQGGQRETVGNVCPLDELHRWAIACALPARPLMEAEIRALHEALHLDCAWQYHNLGRYAREAGMGFDFAAQRRALMQDFAALARAGSEDVQRALAFWLQRYAEIDRELGKRETEKKPWKASKRQRLLEVDVGLLGLWDEEKSPAETLYDLHEHPDLSREVEFKLGQYACLDWPPAPAGEDRWIRLPYLWAEMPAKTRKQLLAAGFGGKAQNLKLRVDNASGVLLGVLAGLALSGLVGSVWGLMPVPAVIKPLLNSAEPAEKIQQIENGKLFMGTAKAGLAEPQVVHDDEIVWVKWERKTRLAREIPPNPPFAKGGEEDEVELWFAGENGKPQRPQVEKWPAVSVAVIAEPPDDPDAQRLAAKLLDNGTADQVLLGENWHKHQADIMQQWKNLPGTQWLYINAEPPPYLGHEHIARFSMKPEALLAKLKQPGVHEANSLQAGATIKGHPRLIGFAPDIQTFELSNGMKLLPIPRGSFQMGSETGDWDEKPVHTVNIKHDFWMSASETTFAQYDAYVETVKGKENPKDQGWGRDSRPVINVSWEDAQGYVKWLSDNNGQGLSCRLPSEAEWEYAARAGTTTDYFWGNDIGQNNANCDGCGSEWDNKQTAPVGSFKANPFGLQDMNGNVYEWVQDCLHDSYTDAPSDGTVWEKGGDCGRRVLRGGSWFNLPGLLRSSSSFNRMSGSRDFYIGFRVVCVLPLTGR